MGTCIIRARDNTTTSSISIYLSIALSLSIYLSIYLSICIFISMSTSILGAVRTLRTCIIRARDSTTTSSTSTMSSPMPAPTAADFS